MPEITDVLLDSRPCEDALHAQLGDARRTRRYARILEAFEARPAASPPEAFDEPAELTAYYRLMRQGDVEHFSLLEPHFDSTRERAEQLGRVLVLHDTTEFAFQIHDEPARQNLARLSANRQGFQWHASLAISPGVTRAPLGLLASRPFVRGDQLADEDALEFWGQLDGLLDNEQRRWLEAVEACEARLEHVEHVVHVMDREADDYLSYFAMDLSDYSYVIRLTHDRNVCQGELRSEYGKLSEALEEQDWCEDEREVLLSARPARRASASHPMRRERKVRLRVRGCTVELRRPNNVKSEHAPDSLELNVVEVEEIEPPEGQEPVRWVLATSEPIENVEQLWAVVDIYRNRWVIEEFFKALKTGTSYKKLQHKRAKTLLNALAAKAQIAWNLLVLRHFGRHMGETPAQRVVNPIQLKVLGASQPKLVGESATAHDAMMAVASMGGHIKANGPPGWMILGRGWQRLLELETGFRLALGMQPEEM